MHMLLYVVVPPTVEPQEMEGYVERQLAPFDENRFWDEIGEDDPNPGKWDWWVIGGRWDGVIQGDDRNQHSGGDWYRYALSEEARQLGNNVRSADSLKRVMHRDPKRFVPFAILTPDAEWNESRTWNGHDFVERETWTEDALELIAKHSDPDHWVVAVDYHS